MDTWLECETKLMSLDDGIMREIITGLSSASGLSLDSPSTINTWLLAVALPAEDECSASQCVFDDDALKHLAWLMICRSTVLLLSKVEKSKVFHLAGVGILFFFEQLFFARRFARGSRQNKSLDSHKSKIARIAGS
jgi:hypothetical protein